MPSFLFPSQSVLNSGWVLNSCINLVMLLLVCRFLVFPNIKRGDGADLLNHILTFLSLMNVCVCLHVYARACVLGRPEDNFWESTGDRTQVFGLGSK